MKFLLVQNIVFRGKITRSGFLENSRARVKVMSYLHLVLGIIFVIIFLVTGKFMRVDFPDKEIIPQDFRLLMRSRHIYILFSSFVHILLGVYLQIETRIWRKTLQLFGSTLLITGSIFLVWAFVYETYTTKTFSEASLWGIYLSLGGTILHLVGGFKVKKVEK
ncbi:MAG: hypothetical protein M3R14_05340 [Acidobacteriota bacterium]|nr:hypothetical protein [Acidobacteriota bacterium]